MVNYYKILRVSQDASRSEIRSAYRRLARKKHPDVNDEAGASREFTHIAKAYKVLSDPKERAAYDKQLLREKFSSRDSIFSSDNPHARRMRQMAYERRYNAIIDRMMEDERREAMALQKVILPVVALFVSTAFAAGLRPQFWSDSNVLGKIVLVTLFVVGALHLVKRLQAGFERYTYSPQDIHDSILREMEEERRPYSRFTAIAFLVTGVVASAAIGTLVRAAFGIAPGGFLQGLFPGSLSPELAFYPPIVVLFVDLMHSFATRFER
jgi:hypothetical protein